MDIFGIGSAIGGIASGISSIYAANKNYRSQQETNEMNYRIAQETNQANLDLYREQYADSVAQWNRENAYNDPSQQVQRLSRAGLNPALNFGSGDNTAGSMSLPSASPAVGATMEAPQIHYSDTYVTQALASLSSLLESSKSSEEAKGLAIDNQYRDAKNKHELDKIIAENQKILADTAVSQEQRAKIKEDTNMAILARNHFEDSYNMNLRSIELQNERAENEIALLKEQKESIRVERSINEFELEARRLKLPLEVQQLRAGINVMFKQIDKMKSDIDLNSKQAQLIVANEAKTWLEANGVADANTRANELAPFIIDQYELNNLKTSYDMQPGFNKLVNLRLSDFSGDGTSTAYIKQQEYNKRHNPHNKK